MESFLDCTVRTYSCSPTGLLLRCVRTHFSSTILWGVCAAVFSPFLLAHASRRADGGSSSREPLTCTGQGRPVADPVSSLTRPPASLPHPTRAQAKDTPPISGPLSRKPAAPKACKWNPSGRPAGIAVIIAHDARRRTLAWILWGPAGELESPKPNSLACSIAASQSSEALP